MGVRPIYRQAIRLVINGIKIKVIGLKYLHEHQVQYGADTWIVTSGNIKGYKSPTVNADLTLKDPIRSLRQIACDALEAASWSSRLFIRNEGRVPKSTFLYRLKGRVLSYRTIAASSQGPRVTLLLSQIRVPAK